MAASKATDSLSRNDSTGSLATDDEGENKLADWMKFWDGKNKRMVSMFEADLKEAVEKEARQAGSSNLNKPVMTRKSIESTPMDYAVHYGRPEALKKMADAVRGGQKGIELSSA